MRFAKKFVQVVRRAKNEFFPIRRAQIGRFSIETTPNHPMTIYPAKFPLYDKFVPALCRLIEGTVIDIGANIGDTMAAILDSNSKIEVVCVEPDDQFFAILERNRKAVDADKRVKAMKVFVSNSSDSYKIVKNATNSTGHIEKVDSEKAIARSLTFGELLREANVAAPTLVKSDTDGFDVKILDSIADHASQHSECQPILFFEMQTYLQNRGFGDPSRRERTSEYFRAIQRLNKLGYTSFIAIDNFGAPILRSSDFGTLEAIDQYISLSQTRNHHVPMYFLDVVMFQPNHSQFVEDALKSLSLIASNSCG